MRLVRRGSHPLRLRTWLMKTGQRQERSIKQWGGKYRNMGTKMEVLLIFFLVLVGARGQLGSPNSSKLLPTEATGMSNDAGSGDGDDGKRIATNCTEGRGTNNTSRNCSGGGLAIGGEKGGVTRPFLPANVTSNDEETTNSTQPFLGSGQPWQPPPSWICAILFS